MSFDLYLQFFRFGVPLDKQLFTNAINSWPDHSIKELQETILEQFGDSNLTTPSVVYACNHLRCWPLDRLIEQTLIHLGECSLDDRQSINNTLCELRRCCWFLMAGCPDKTFQNIDALNISEATSFVKGLALAEEMGYSRYRGSPSLVPRAFEKLVYWKHCSLPSRSALIDWIVENTSNPWIPFGFRKERDDWERCRSPGMQPMEISHAVCKLNEWRAVNQAKHEVRMVIQQFKAGKYPSELDSEDFRSRVLHQMEQEIFDQN